MRTLFEEMGGDSAIEAIVELHYARVLGDPQLAPFFDGLDMPLQKRKFRAFLHTVTGGMGRRSDLELRAAHSRALDQGLTAAHVDIFIDHLTDALSEAHIDEDLAGRVLWAVRVKRAHVMGT